MQKTAEEESFMNIDMPVVARYGLGGLGLGAGTAAGLSLINMIKRLREERAQEEDTDEGTIVLTLPKRASDYSEAGIGQPTVTPGQDNRPAEYEGEEGIIEEGGMVTTSGKADKVTTNSHELGTNNAGQMRQPSGQFGDKIYKTAAWPTLTAALLAGGAGTAVGYKLIDQIYQNRMMKKKEEELDLAKQEYLDMLTKASSDKEAGDFNIWDYPAGLGALALILGSGGTAFLTKRVLDEHARSPEGAEPTKIKRIVFRSEPAGMEAAGDDSVEQQPTEELKAASAEGEENKEIVKAALGVYLDVCGSKYDILKVAYVDEELTKCDLSAGDLYKMAGSSYNDLMATLQANPELRQLITKASMEQHPVLKYFKWTSGLPGISGYADKKIYQNVADTFGQTGEKVAGILDLLSGITASTIGSNIAEKDDGKSRLQKMKDRRDPEGIEEDEPIDIEAGDPEAEKFVLKNKAQILKAIETLKAQGKL